MLMKLPRSTYLTGLVSLCAFFPVGGRELQNNETSVFVPGLFDTENFDWGEEIFRFTVSLINDHSDGWFDSVLNDGTDLDWTIADAGCDATVAARAYWDLRTKNSGKPHGIVGCRCSSASTAVARIAGLEQVPQISPSSTSARLSDKEEFPFLARVVSAEETSALMSMLRFFGWNRVTILATDTQYASDQLNEFQSLWVGVHDDSSGTWEGEIAYSHSVGLDPDGSVSTESVRQALEGVPTDDPTTNSRIILLLCHDQHAYPILKIATETSFQPDTIWIGTQSWVNRSPPDGDFSWLPNVPGYIGLTPYRNRNEIYQDYLQRLQTTQMNEGKSPWKDLPDYAAEHMVDSIVAMAMALSKVPREMRLDGNRVTSELLNLTFDGVSGSVSFTEQGDRRDPRFTIFNLQPTDTGYSWVDVGVAETKVGDTFLYESGIDSICFAELGCGVDAIPADSYPIPEDPPSPLLIIVIPVILLLLLSVTVLYCRTKRKKRLYKESMTEMQKRMEKMKKIDGELLDIDEQVEEAKKRQALLILQRAELQGKPDTWSDTLSTIVEVPPEDEQYWTVLDRMRESLDDAHISKIWRIQNTSLWSYYSFHKDRLLTHGIDHGERSVWHGTSSLDPEVIYNDQQDGFMMQFAAQGFWGRGIYFAEKAAYSTHYSFRPPASSLLSSLTSGSDSRLGGREDEREMFLAKLLVGNDVLLDRDQSSAKAREYKNLTVPPTNNRTGLKYNTVTGHTGGSQVWVVYENGRAYPDYLVRYYRGDRDPSRSPYKSKCEAMKNRQISDDSTDLDAAEMGIKRLVTGSTNSSGSSISSSKYCWEYLDNSGWKPYSAAHQSLIEQHHQNFAKKKASSSIVQIKSDEWTYEVDVALMTQTNTGHPTHRQRDVRRRTA